MKRLFVVALTLLAGATIASAQGPKIDPKVPGQVKEIIAKYCYQCHGQTGSAQGGFTNALDFKALIAEGGKITPGDTKKSRLYRVMQSGRMPPEENDKLPRPSEAEVAIVKGWIEAGAPAPADDKIEYRAAISIGEEVKAIYDYLKTLDDPEDAKYIRFFTMTHLHNKTPAGPVGDRELRLYRAAMSKLVNSLSWKREIVLPVPIDKYETIFALDTRRVDWNKKPNLWLQVINEYPYGLKHHQYPDDRKVNNMAKEIYSMCDTDIPAVRIDWFVATAARAPLYDILLQLPKHASILEHKLGVDVYQNFKQGVANQSTKMTRAGFTQSGVSGHNRMVERHEIPNGAYWKSYDFKSSSGTGNLYVYPLGPVFKDNPYSRHAFKHDGGEIIFNLPNGLQGYMLVDGKDNQIQAGPIEVVSDPVNRSSGTPAIVNGLSCMVCHKRGSIALPTEEVRKSHILGGEAKIAVERLYPPKKVMDEQVKEDEDRFVRSLEKAVGRYLRVGEDEKKSIDELPEPIQAIAKWYLLQDMTPQEVAQELGVKDVQVLQFQIKANNDLRRAGLSPLSEGGKIKRETWEFLEFRDPPYQQLANILKVGTPILMKTR